MRSTPPAARYEPTVPARYTAPLLEAMRAHRPSWLARALAEAGLDAAVLQDADATLTMARLDALLTALARHTGRGDLGFELGRRISFQHHGALAAVLPRARTLEDLLRLLSRYSRLITPTFFLHYRRRTDHGEFIWRPAAPMSSLTLRAVEEIVAVSFHVQITSVLPQRLRRYDIYLSMPVPRHVARYRELRPARFHFGHLPLPEVRIVIDLAQLDACLAWPDSGSVQTEEAEIVGLHRGIRRATRWSEWVAMMLREAEGTQPTLRELAELLSVSPRTLTRYLASEGLTLRGLANDVRHRRACELLKDPHQSVAEIAWRLGYGDPTNFSHAFRAVTGLSPRDYRARRQGSEVRMPGGQG
jgi:AraC-like DNA-binding protein